MTITQPTEPEQADTKLVDFVGPLLLLVIVIGLGLASGHCNG